MNRHSESTFVSWLVLGIVAALPTGCEKSGGRQSVTGTVTFAGQPLADGYITFRPIDQGRSEGAQIIGGKFHIPSDMGLSPGKYRVEIKAMRAVGKPYVDSESGLEEQDREQFIPARYNAQTELMREVNAAGENRFDFALAGNED